jgi:RimJ/RimL family protein N-acetyltransferase
VRLRPVIEDDLPKLAEWDDDPEITRWAGKRFEQDEDAREWYLSGGNLQRRTFAIETRRDGLIGEIEVINISWRLHSAEIRILIGRKDLWDQGLGEESMRVLVHGLFQSTSLTEVFLRVDEGNRRARRCYAKVGFKPRGRVHLRSDKPSTLVLMKLDRRDLETPGCSREGRG